MGSYTDVTDLKHEVMHSLTAGAVSRGLKQSAPEGCRFGRCQIVKRAYYVE